MQQLIIEIREALARAVIHKDVGAEDALLALKDLAEKCRDTEAKLNSFDVFADAFRKEPQRCKQP